jgi:hypothetical protein
MTGLTPTVLVTFWGAILVDGFIIAYFYRIRQQTDGRGLIYTTVMYVGLSAAVFGLHHLGELYLHDLQYGVTIAEGLESVAAIFLLFAVYNLYKITKVGQ